MKLLSASLGCLLFIFSCNSQQTPYEQAIKVKDAIEAARPGTIPTTPGEYTMTAIIDGQEWKASSMMPVELAGRIAGYYKDEFISLPRFEKKFIRVGKKEVFGQENTVELSTGGNKYFSGYIGEIEVTKIDNEWMEGKFYFTGTDNASAKVKVTNGFVRVKF